MKIAFYIPNLDKGGPNRVFVELANGLATLGNTVIIVTNVSNGYYFNAIKSPVTYYSLQAKAKYPYRAFYKTIRVIKPDIILATLSSIITVTICRLMFRIQVPVVIRPANHFSQNSLLLFRKNPFVHSVSFLFNLLTFYLADHIVCQSRDLWTDYKRYFIKERKLTIIPNPIHVSEIDLNEDAAPTNDLIAIGRLSNDQKGFDVLIHAIKIVKEVYPTISLQIYGEGPDRAKMEHQIDKLGLTNNVKLMGFCENVLPRIANSKFLVCSSIVDAFPNVILEALSLGVPVISTNASSGIRDLVIPELTGWLCAPNSEIQLSVAINEAMRAKQLNKELIRSYVKNNFSTSIISQKYSILFRSLIPKKKNYAIF